jgi:hypothetical protein
LVKQLTQIVLEIVAGVIMAAAKSLHQIQVVVEEIANMTVNAIPMVKIIMQMSGAVVVVG